MTYRIAWVDMVEAVHYPGSRQPERHFSEDRFEGLRLEESAAGVTITDEGRGWQTFVPWSQVRCVMRKRDPQAVATPRGGK